MSVVRAISLKSLVVVLWITVGVSQSAGQSTTTFLEELGGKGSADLYAEGLNALNSGLSKFEVGDYSAAVAALSTPSVQQVSSIDLATYFLAESYFHSGSFEKAAEILSSFQETYPESKWRDFAQARFGDVLGKTGKHEQALGVYQTLLTERKDYPHPGALKMSIAHELIALGRHQEGTDFLFRFVTEYPRHVYRQRADTILNGLARKGFRPTEIGLVEAFRITRSLRRRRLHQDALAWTKQLTKRPGLSKKDAWMARYHHARILLNARQFRLAIQSFESLAEDAPSARLKLRTHKWRSRAYEGLGDVKGAIEAQDAYWDIDEEYSPKRRVARGSMYLRHGKFRKASEWFKGASLKRDREGRRLRVVKPIAEFSAGRTKIAREHFELYEERGFGRERGVMYWKARVDAATGRKSAAIAGYERLTKRSRGYYSEQSRARLRELGIESPESWKVEPAPESSKDAARFKRLFGQALPSLPESIMRSAILQAWREAGHVFPDLKAAFESVYVGRADDSIWHLRRVANELIAFHVASGWKKKRWSFKNRELMDYRKGPTRGPWGEVRDGERVKSSKERIRDFKKLDLYRLAAQLTFIFERIGDYHYVLKLVHIKRKKKGRARIRTRRDLELSYPRAYRSIVETEAEKYGIEPYILWALMRTESSFNTLAVSPAEARGLMQVIWQTSQRISESGGFVDMGNAQILLPSVSIALGAYYTSILLEKFAQQKPLAFAGYNAGPHRIAAWLDRKPMMKMDQFVEEIPYLEARLYVKKVLETLLVYRRLYERDAGQWIDQKINRTYLESPDY